MLNRRHIRIKVMQLIYAFQGGESDDLKIQERLLDKSMTGMYELYLLLIDLMIKVVDKAENHLQIAKQKHLATEADKNPNYKFISNSVLSTIKGNETLMEALGTHKITNWDFDDEYVDVIFRSTIKSDLYDKYMGSQKRSIEEDRDFILKWFKTIIAPNEKLYDYFEDKKITWLDDLPVVNTLIVKVLKKLNDDNASDLLVPDLFKDKDDKQFGIDLLNKTILNTTSLNEEIAEKTMNWDKDRIANIDLVLLQMAITELKKFPSIPIKVTINEYLEIAKEYSTPKSSVFVNGILDKLVKEYQAKGTLNKMGRGLM